jgi:integrative and conjugative element protein (TIGR02256 family)
MSGGAIQVISGPFPSQRRGWLAFDISLDLAGMNTTPGGIAIRARERFLVAVGPTYPFVAPDVYSAHTRWAGSPHVNWANQICLYLAPAQEWAPEDGMRGLIDRLIDWLSHAATASLDPVGQPPHPPVSYADPTENFAVIHGDIGDLAPPAQETHLGPVILIGWGAGGDRRLDVDAWFLPEVFTELESSGSLPKVDGRPQACVCFLLTKPIAFEYPSDVAGLAIGLQQAGVTSEAFREATRLAIVATAARMPKASRAAKSPKQRLPAVAVFIGSPSRSVDGLQLKTHLVGFTLDLYTPDLNTVLETIAPSTGKVVTPDATKVKLPWLVIYENRPEITQRRDKDSPLAHLQDRRILILGAGALGAPVAEACVRAGASVTIVDNGRVTPGVLVRQPYYDSDIGSPKALVLADRLNRVVRRPKSVDAIFEDSIGAFFQKPHTPDFDLVIDATANAGVRVAIDRSRASDRDSWPPLVTMLVGHVATLGLLTVSAPGASGGGHDILRRTGIASRRPGSGLRDIAEEFFPYPPRTEVFQPEPGCSEPTFTGSAADLGVLANSMLLTAVVAAVVHPDQHLPMSAIAVRSPLASNHDEPAGPGVVRMSWANDRVQNEEDGEFEVRVSRAALNDMRSEARRRARLHPELVETGGMLIGTVDEGVGCIFVDRACPPTPDSWLGRKHFEHGTDGAQSTVDHFREASAHASGFVGMWHTHPQGIARPSDTDEAGMGSLVVPVNGVSRALMLIVAGEGARWESWREADGAADLYLRQISSTSTASASAQRPRPAGEYFPAGITTFSAPAAGSTRWFSRWVSSLSRSLRKRES